MGELALPLRTLTKKSQMKFGRFCDLKVGDLLKVCRYEYIRWCYYNLSHINFVDEILSEVGIGEDYVIKKPGRNKEMFSIVNAQCWAQLKREDVMAYYGAIRSKRKWIHGLGRVRENKQSMTSRKGRAQRYNHGHRIGPRL